MAGIWPRSLALTSLIAAKNISALDFLFLLEGLFKISVSLGCLHKKYTIKSEIFCCRIYLIQWRTQWRSCAKSHFFLPPHLDKLSPLSDSSVQNKTKETGFEIEIQIFFAVFCRGMKNLPNGNMFLSK